MRTLILVLIPLAAFTSFACGGTADSTATGSGTGGTTTSTTSATTSAGGATSTTSSATSSGSGGAGGSAGCVGFIDVTETNAATQHFGSICAGSWGSSENMTAVGYHFSGGAAPGLDELNILGCATTAAGSPGMHFSTPKVAAPGTFTDGSASYTDGGGAQWNTGLDPYNIVITQLDPPGGVIEGTFNLSVTGPTDAKKTLTGKFHVCRVADENAP